MISATSAEFRSHVIRFLTIIISNKTLIIINNYHSVPDRMTGQWPQAQAQGHALKLMYCSYGIIMLKHVIIPIQFHFPVLYNNGLLDLREL